MGLRGDEKIRAIENAEKVREGIRLRHEGYSWDEVADMVGWASRGAAFTQIDRFMRKVIAETTTDVEVYRFESLERLRELVKALWPRRADEKVAAEIRRCTERMDKLTGAERPTRIEFGEGDVDRAIRELDEQIIARAAGDAGEAGIPAQ
jgi:hypothetical protein